MTDPTPPVDWLELLEPPALPSSSDGFFTSQEDWWNNACLNWCHNGWSLYASGYKEAADILVQRVEAHNAGQDTLVYPAMFRNRVFFSEIPSKPILVTWPKKNKVFDTEGDMESIVINPTRLYESIQAHFNRYIKTLREGTDPALKHSFEAVVKLKWALDEPDRVIGMTTDEFHKT